VKNQSNIDLTSFTNLNKIKLPNPLKILSKLIIYSIIFVILVLALTPWQQTSKGFGSIIANDPNNRTQEINSPISGKIKKWHVRDGAKVKQNDIIAEIVDNDPQILERIKAERDAKKRKLDVAQIASETAKINYERQNELFLKGLSSRRDFEEAKIEYKKLLSSKETAASELAESETKLSRQENQIIYAPKDGVILKVTAGDNATIVQAGDKIATFAPDLTDPAIELYVNSNDIPLIYEGRKVRLQFEGWPAVQFSGWPSLAIGTFGGIVSAVDSSISENGKFRIIIKKPDDENWPDQKFLRHGTKAYGWVLLNEVKIGYEIWRQINSFPPEFDQQGSIVYPETIDTFKQINFREKL
jgi:multidrug efflux pump subunit AcrA (membrane-fusion protein)